MEPRSRVVAGEVVGSGDILKARQTRLSEGYDMSYKRRKGNQGFFGLTNGKNRVAVKLGGEDFRRRSFLGRIRSSVLVISRMTYLISS